MTNEPPVRIAELRPRRPSADDYVWHLVATRPGEPAARGERLASVGLPPEAIADLADASLRDPRDRLRAGLRRVRAAMDLERRRYVRLLIAGGYDGWGVQVIAERGYRRTVYPGIAPLVTPSPTSSGGPT